TKEAEKAGRGSDSLLRGKIESADHQEQHRRVDKETNHAKQAETDPQFICGTVNDSEVRQEHGNHAEDTDHAAAAAELIREPAHEDGADNGRKLESRRACAAFADAGVLYLLQVSRPPVEHAVAGDIDKEVGESKQ